MIGRSPVLLAGVLFAAALPAPCSARDSRAKLPADVRAFVEKRTRCDHLRGEDPYDAARAAELDRGMRANCTGTDAALARLKHAHRRDPQVMTVLSGYDARIE